MIHNIGIYTDEAPRKKVTNSCEIRLRNLILLHHDLRMFQKQMFLKYLNRTEEICTKNSLVFYRHFS